MRTRRVLASLAVATTTTTLLTGCFSDAIPDDWSVGDALTQIPMVDQPTDRPVSFSAADVHAAVTQAGLERGESDDAQDLDAWLVPITGGRDGAPVYISPPAELVVSLVQTREVAGFDLGDVDAFATAAAPPFHFTSLTGDITLDTLPGEGIEVADGVVSDSDDDDHTTDLAGASEMLSPIGVPTRFAAKDGRFVFTTSTPAAAAWLSGDGGTLADDEAYAAIATALDAADVVSAVIEPRPEPAMLPGGLQIPEVFTAMPAFDVVGIGWSAVDGDARIQVVYHLTEPADEAAADALRAAWTDGVFLRQGRPIADTYAVLDAVASDSTVTLTLAPETDGGTRMIHDVLISGEIVFAGQ